MSAGKVCLIATMDTKAEEARFLRNALWELGLEVMLIDIGIRGESPADVDVTQREILGQDAPAAACASSRTQAASYMMRGLCGAVTDFYRKGELDAVVSLGGSGGTSIASAAMRELPLGIPKVIVSTMASGNTLPYVQGEDILLINPVVDIQNLNFLTTHALRQAAAVVAALLGEPLKPRSQKRAVAISGFGVTTPCVEYCVNRLEKAGFEVLVFHARGISGGRIMEKMIAEGSFAGVLDLTTSEIVDEAAGGIYAVGPQRLRTAAQMGVPYVVTPGALEMVNLGTEDTLTADQKKRVLYRHSPSSVKMRANEQELRACARIFADRLAKNSGNVAVLAAKRGFSMVNREGEVFYDPQADGAFLEELTACMPPQTPVRVLDLHHNDEAFAEACVQTLLALMAAKEEL